MDVDRLKPLYVFGIVFNAVALAYALSTGALLYAIAFAVVIGYLAFRYRMVSTGRFG